MEPVPEELRPEWDRRFPGRLAWELERLQAQTTNIVVNQEKLAEGIVEIDLTWLVRGEHIPLRATFQTSYPYMRPHVQLRADPTTWPRRHISPLDGGLCLLGRDSTQWRPGDGLAGLLMLQLEAALHGGGAEDPQGEPAEYWWNQKGLPDSYCLVDSGWDLGTADHGTLTIKLAMEPPRKRETVDDEPLPAFQIVVQEVRDSDGRVLASWAGPVPDALKAAKAHTLKWLRSATTLTPQEHCASELNELRRTRIGGPGSHVPMGHGLAARPFIFLHPIELTEDRMGDGWLVGIEWGALRAFVPSRGPGSNKHMLKSGYVPVYRAGTSDLGSRVPAFSALAGKTVTVVGVGALGAPVAIELARNGAAEVRLVDHDIVEPGNSVRWPLGAFCWGLPKVNALREHLQQHYPRCKVSATRHAIGGLGVSDSMVLRPLLQAAGLVIDASASASVNRTMWDLCQQMALPLIRLGATPEVKGGTVMVHAVGGPCPTCLDIARHHGRIERPAGDRDTHLIQPTGCGERTFVGADFDLQELSLQAVRCAIASLTVRPDESSVYTLSLRNAQDESIPPAWVMQVLQIQCECSSHVAEPD